MTINQLHKLLGKMIDNGHARKPVCINKRTFTHACESDGCVILDIRDGHMECITIIDDDGGQKFRSDGSECLRSCLVLVGDDYPTTDAAL